MSKWAYGGKGGEHAIPKRSERLILFIYFSFSFFQQYFLYLQGYIYIRTHRGFWNRVSLLFIHNLLNLQETINYAFLAHTNWGWSLGEHVYPFYLYTKETSYNIFTYPQHMNIVFCFSKFVMESNRESWRHYFWRRTLVVNIICLCKNWKFNSQCDNFICTHFCQNSCLHYIFFGLPIEQMERWQCLKVLNLPN